MSDNNFLFIEIEDRDIIFLLDSLRNIFSPQAKRTSIHVTIKGPQKTPFKIKAAEKFLKKSYPLVIDGAGIFENNGLYIVYMKVILNELKSYKLWYKPDFPNEFNPHITLYEGYDPLLAKSICEFISDEIGRLSTTNYNFIPYKSRQLDFLSISNYLAEGGLTSLVRHGLIKEDVLDKAKQVNKKLENSSEIF